MPPTIKVILNVSGIRPGGFLSQLSLDIFELIEYVYSIVLCNHKNYVSAAMYIDIKITQDSCLRNLLN